MSHPATSLPPGFRFHPTDEELILHYLRNRAAATPCPVSIIAEVDIYKFDPWDLPPKAMFGDREWYFFSPRDRKYPNGVRPNRAAASGYWKATGTDKPIHATSGNENIGVKKALVFYKGRPPKGLKTNWIMHEYRLAEAQPNTNTYRPMRLRDSSMRLDDWVLCRIYKKSNHVAGEVQATTEQEQDDSGSEDVACLPNSASMNTMQAKPLDLHKSSSLSEFLNLLFDNPAEILGPETGPAMAHAGSNQVMFNGGSSINNGNGYLYQKLTNGKTTTTTPVSVVDNTLKRHYTTGNIGDDAASFIPATKKLNNSCIAPSFTSQFNNPQYGVLNQALLNQQLLLNSHLGLQ